MQRPIAVKKQPLQQQQPQQPQSAKMGHADEDSAEEVIIAGSPQQQSLTEQNVLKLMANKCKEFPSQNILKSNPSAAYVLRSEKKFDHTNNANIAAGGLHLMNGVKTKTKTKTMRTKMKTMMNNCVMQLPLYDEQRRSVEQVVVFRRETFDLFNLKHF